MTENHPKVFIIEMQLTPEKWNLQGKLKKVEISGVRVIESCEQMTGNKGKTVFNVLLSIVYILIKFTE